MPSNCQDTINENSLVSTLEDRGRWSTERRQTKPTMLTDQSGSCLSWELTAHPVTLCTSSKVERTGDNAATASAPTTFTRNTSFPSPTPFYDEHPHMAGQDGNETPAGIPCRLIKWAVWQLQPIVVRTVQQPVSYEFIWKRRGHVTIFSWMFAIACSLVVGWGLGLDLAPDW